MTQWLGVLALVGMLALLAWLAASIFWSLTGPAVAPPVVAIETDPARAAQGIAARHLFGEASEAGAVVKAVGVPDIALRGVVAPTREGRPGVAVLAVTGKPPISVREGDEIVPGVTLHRVLPRSVELERGRQVQTLSLPERTTPSAPPQPAR
ncbi:MAG: type II secretion system protein N [Rhodospirillaceae bacterium]